jgi:hypothetical protein
MHIVPINSLYGGLLFSALFPKNCFDFVAAFLPTFLQDIRVAVVHASRDQLKILL